MYLKNRVSKASCTLNTTFTFLSTVLVSAGVENGINKTLKSHLSLKMVQLTKHFSVQKQDKHELLYMKCMFLTTSPSH